MPDNADTLLVPIAVEGLVVNHLVQNKVTFHRWEMEYANLKDFLSPAPPAFGNEAFAQPSPGVHLHWAMPRALTRGQQVQATATANVLAGQVTSMTVENGGYGYHDELPPIVTLVGDNGSGALVNAVVTNGVVTGFVILSPGSGYTKPPRVTIAPSPAISFPYVPNRWLVIRYSPAASPSQPRLTKAWIMQSDNIDPNADALESNSFVDPFKSQPGAIETTRLGTRATVLESWEGESGSSQQLFLRAVGPGQATFAAFQPGVVNVFSFYDPIRDPDPGTTSEYSDYQTTAQPFPENTPLTYSVIGWYSDPTHDPLYGPVSSWDQQGHPTRSPWSGAAAWDTLISDLDWSVQDADKQATLPSQCLFHGSVYDVIWQTANLPPGATRSTDPMTVAVGNTSIDALSAIVQKYADTPADGSKEAEMLEAFQYGFLKTLDDPDGEAQLDLQIRQAWFGSVPGGTMWRVVASQTGQTPTGQLAKGSVPPPPPLTLDQESKLGELNRNQRALDQAQQLLASMQWELYGTWWKQNRLQAISNDPAAAADLAQYLGPTFNQISDVQQLVEQNLDPANNDGLYQQVVTQQASVQTQMQALPDPTNPASIAHYATSVLGLDTTKLQLKAAALPSFYQPADPVLLVSGIPTSEKQGALAADGPLFCRFSSQAVTGVSVQTGGQTVTATGATGSLQQAIPLISNSHLPAAVAAGIHTLNVENFFVDSADAATILAAGFNSTDQSSINQLAGAMAAQTAQSATIENPLAAGFAFSVWNQQPWSPLFLEWQVTFNPTVQPNQINNDDWPFANISAQNPPPQQSQPCWSFDGTDFNWSGGLSYVLSQDSPPVSTLAAKSYVGRTFLTPQSTYILIARLKKYLADDPNADLQAVNDLIDKIGDWNFLSQRLSGLIDQLIMRDLEQSQPPDDSVAQQVGEEFHATPDPTIGNHDIDFGGGTPFFFPVRGGFLKFERLTVIDGFGQVIDLMNAGGNIGTGVSWAPVRGPGLVPTQNTQLPQPSELIQLSPRLVQTSRLNFRFISAANDEYETGLWPDSSPVCGWVLPNHLDQGLAIYDAAGNAVGELMLLADSAGLTQVRWLPAPDSPSAVNDPTGIANSHLSKFVVALTQTQDQGQGFQTFLQAVDETLWTVDPLGSRADQNLSVLIGRPLALIRAQLQFELEGQPVFNQSWRDTLQKQTAGIENLQIPVRLGSLDLYDDGLMGYFLDDNYVAFNSVHQPDGFQPETGSYLDPVGYNGNYINLALNYLSYSTQLSPNPTQLIPNSTQLITMLLDPRGDVHAFTGILPVKTVSLPADYFEDALAKMAMTFRTGPVLTDADTVRIPCPTEKNGTWSWIQRNTPADPQHWTDPSGWKVETIVNADQKARLPSSSPRLLEGWLKLTPSDIEK